MRKFDAVEARAMERWPALLLHAGWMVFAIACLSSARLPVEALLVGPGMMLAGAVMRERDKRESRGLAARQKTDEFRR